MQLDMALLQLPRPGRPESLARVVLVPDVKVADLRALGRQDPTDLPGLDLPRLGTPYRNRERLHLLASTHVVCRVSDPLVKLPIARDGVICGRRRLGHGV